MKALITGITGFVGSHLAEYLIDHTDWKIVGMTRWNDNLDNLQNLIHRINAGHGLRLVEGDLRDALSMGRVIAEGFDYIFHLAAQSYVQSSYVSPVETLETNALGTLYLMAAVRKHCPEALVHNCSSSEVYGNPEKTPIDESAPFSPLSPYAISKATADMTGRMYHAAYGLRVLTTRMFTHTGPRRGDVFAESSFAKQIAMIEAGMIEDTIQVGNLDSVRTIADVRDAVRAYHMLLTVDPKPGEVYNIGGAHTCTIREILTALFEQSKVYSIHVDSKRLRPLDLTLQIPDCSKFTERTGWMPLISFKQTMRDLLSYWRGRVLKGTPLQR